MESDSSHVGLLGQHDPYDIETKIHPSPRPHIDDDHVESATSAFSASIHMVVFFLACLVLRTLLLLGIFEDDPVAPAVFLIVVCAAANVSVDVRWYGVHRHVST